MGKGIILVHFRVLLRVIAVVVVEGKAVGATVTAVGAEKHIKGVGATEEGGKGGMRISMKSVVVR